MCIDLWMELCALYVDARYCGMTEYVNTKRRNVAFLSKSSWTEELDVQHGVEMLIYAKAQGSTDSKG